MHDFSPTRGEDRIAALDVLRGFALFGIFLVNMEWFSRPFQSFGQGVPPGLDGIDFAAAWIVHVFFAGKFWILFSIMFGMGFALMLERAQAAGRPFAGVYLRRIAVLLVIGIAHALLLWVGDILHSYALAAVLLLLMRNLRPKTQLWIGVGGFVGIAALALLGGLATSMMPPEAESEMAKAVAEAASAGTAAAQAYAGGGYAEITAQRASDFAMVLGYDVFVVPAALLMFLIGAWFVRSGRIRDIAAHRGFFARLALGALPVGLALSLGGAALGVSYPPGGGSTTSIAPAVMLFGSLPLSLGYLSLVMLVLSGPAPRLLSWLAPAGRMALTNYLLQSLLCTLVFYGYGLAQWGRIAPTGQVLLVLVIFAAQVVFSHWWLSRFRFGPVEWLWRWATYGEKPAMRNA